MMGALAEETGWLRGIAECELDGDAERLAARRRADGLVFTRWALVVFNFEHQLYTDPDRDDLNSLWWDLVERLQLVKRPSGRDKPDRAAKIHIAVAPVYYHKYVLGNLISGQLRGHLEAHVTHGPFYENEVVGRYLVEGSLAPAPTKPGATQCSGPPWRRLTLTTSRTYSAR